MLLNWESAKKPDSYWSDLLWKPMMRPVMPYKKCTAKNLDLIVLNSLKDKEACFGYDTNKVTLIDREENQYAYGLKRKREVAKDIVDRIAGMTGSEKV